MAIKIFVSSKIKFLKVERNIAEKVIEQQKFIPIRCEKWGASARHTEATCRRKVRESDIIIFIFGKHYSRMTECEYDETRKWKKPFLAFTKQTSQREVPLQNLLSKIKEHAVVEKFKTENEFRKKLDLSLSDLIEERVKSEAERAVIRQAYYKCGSMNDKILDSNISIPDNPIQRVPLDALKTKLITGKREIEKILESGL